MHYGVIVNKEDKIDLDVMLRGLYVLGNGDPFILTNDVESKYRIDLDKLDHIDNYTLGEKQPDPWNLMLSWHNGMAGNVPIQCLFHEFTTAGHIPGFTGDARLVLFLGNYHQWQSLVHPDPFVDSPKMIKRQAQIKADGKLVSSLPWVHGGKISIYSDGTLLSSGGAPHFGHFKEDIPIRMIKHRRATDVPGYPEGLTIVDGNGVHHYL